MPIRAERMALYPGGSINSPEWKAIREGIRDRAADKCEWCKVSNGHKIFRSECGTAYSYAVSGEPGIAIWCATTGSRLDFCKLEWKTSIKIVCTTAHLNHDESDNDPNNLAFLCQRCHLTYDAKHHATNAAASRRAKLAIGDLFDPNCNPSLKTRARRGDCPVCKRTFADVARHITRRHPEFEPVTAYDGARR